MTEPTPLGTYHQDVSVLQQTCRTMLDNALKDMIHDPVNVSVPSDIRHVVRLVSTLKYAQTLPLVKSAIEKCLSFKYMAGVSREWFLNGLRAESRTSFAHDFISGRSPRVLSRQSLDSLQTLYGAFIDVPASSDTLLYYLASHGHFGGSQLGACLGAGLIKGITQSMPFLERRFLTYSTNNARIRMQLVYPPADDAPYHANPLVTNAVMRRQMMDSLDAVLLAYNHSVRYFQAVRESRPGPNNMLSVYVNLTAVTDRWRQSEVLETHPAAKKADKAMLRLYKAMLPTNRRLRQVPDMGQIVLDEDFFAEYDKAFVFLKTIAENMPCSQTP